LFLLTLAQDYWTFFVIYISIVSIGHNAGYFHPLSTLVNYWFVRHRGVGLALVSAAPIWGHDSRARPVRDSPHVWLARRRDDRRSPHPRRRVARGIPLRGTPESLGLYPDGESPDQGPPSAGAATPLLREPEYSVREALRTRVFWILAGSISVRLFVTVGLNVHLVPILVWGAWAKGGRYVVSLYALGSLIAILGIGWLGTAGASLACAAWGSCP